jgi:uncharacterized membrane protein HdeD (DUF308 family)
MDNKKYFFGWGNIKKGIAEIIKIYSTKKSFFSKKRIESGIAFIIAQWGMVFYLLKKYPDLTMMDISMWAAIEFGISGYIIHQIQKEKKTNDNSEENNQ